MSATPSPILPRPLPDPAYLHRLRQRALARLRLEEEALTGRRITRRRSLQRLALLSAAIAPAIRTLFRGHAALAESSTLLRTSAPQYGAPNPGLPGNPSPYRPPNPVSLADLGSPAAWFGSPAQLAIPGYTTNVWAAGMKSIPAKATFYRLPSGDILPLIAIPDAHTGATYILRGRQAFYIADDSGIRGCIVGDRELVLTEPLFKVASAADATDDAIRAFGAQIDDNKLLHETDPAKAVHISLADVPAGVWPANGSRDPWVSSVHLEGNLLELHLMVYGGSGTFKVDLRKKKLVQFKSDAAGKWYGRP